jgi:uncharacterized protein (TIGR00251 family)
MKVSVRVTAGAKKESIEVARDGRLKIAVKEKAEGGKANERVLALVAKHFKVSPKKVHLVRGHKSPSKIFEVG